MSAIASIDPRLCPLCGQANQCAMEVELASGSNQQPCWCAQTVFTAELLARIPEPARGNACLCAACSQAATA